MKFFTKLLTVLVIAAASIVPAQAQFKWGIKAGVAVNSLKFNKDVVNSDNRAGFTGGLMADFTVPVVGIGFDASVLYAARSVDFSYTGSDGVTDVTKKTRSYIDIPINLKYKIGLPIVGKIVTPFLTTGPDFSFLLSKENMGDAVKNKTFDFAWNVGLGVQLLNHVQIAASYGFGLTKSASQDQSLYTGKNRCWTITAAYLF
ncbi:MAG: PorT family protein [Clostridiales bacterium]|nr:PorT family protein [Clostridiales bacterium]